MSDSFADLWASSAPTTYTPQQPQKKAGSTVPPRRQQYDTFSILSASQPSSRPVANNQLSDRQTRQPQPAAQGGDAFSDLFTSSLDGTPASRNPDRANMTMAERAALAQKAKVVTQNSAASAQIQPASSPASLWDGLDALARPTTASPRPPASTQGHVAVRDTFDFEFDSAPADGAAPTTSPPDNTSIENDDWGLSDFTSPPSESRSVHAPTNPASGSRPTTLWDLDEFGSSELQVSQPQPQLPSRSLTGTPGDFDFGDREDGLIEGDNTGAEDMFGIHGGHSGHQDILGDLGKPLVRYMRHVRTNYH